MELVEKARKAGLSEVHVSHEPYDAVNIIIRMVYLMENPFGGMKMESFKKKQLGKIICWMENLLIVMRMERNKVKEISRIMNMMDSGLGGMRMDRSHTK